VNRRDFQELAQVRLIEAKALLDAGHCDGAYYLAGYAVECALKACISRLTLEGDFPDRRRVDDSYTHDFGRLVRAAALEEELSAAKLADQRFALNWSKVTDWNEGKRYERIEEAEATGLYEAISEQPSGVLRWLQRYS
jgi:HEPN domain-containing protein